LHCYSPEYLEDPIGIIQVWGCFMFWGLDELR